MERCLSGLKCGSRKAVSRKGPWVRLPPSPPSPAEAGFGGQSPLKPRRRGNLIFNFNYSFITNTVKIIFGRGSQAADGDSLENC